MNTGTWTPAIAINGGQKTRAERTSDEQRAWADRARAIRARATAALIKHGATPDDLAAWAGGAGSDRVRWAAIAFYGTLTADQIAAMQPAARGVVASPGTVLDLWEGLETRGDFVRMYDEFLPIAEIVWPEVKS